MRPEDVLSNLKSFGMWDFKNYPLTGMEGKVIIDVLEKYIYEHPREVREANTQK